ncbi:MAG: respiratory nitrate reductase subunit gamma [Acidobacteria bacterium]|nr:MAG: respiratory nitrate reductase subunit gamma [Acidobacteriota bacterium]
MDVFLFIAFPYLALVLAIGVGIYRRRRNPYTYSSLSSQLLENRRLFWGSVPWHYGITLILLAHLLVALFPGAAEFILGGRYRLLTLELTGMALALFALFGLLVLIIRRLPAAWLARRTTSYMDGILLGFLLLQVSTGIIIAVFDRWGSLWYLRTAVPWFWSLVKLRPDMSTVARLPGLVKLHFVFGFAVILLFPFTRLVHLVMFPLQYLWRPYQVVIWNRHAGQEPKETLK